jgi:hypothetical protein
MKEADIFESWINNLAEGTWNLPETPEQLQKLKELMSKELIVGPDATNATEQLYDIVGDDVLFDRLDALASRDPRANVWNDTEVMDRLRELGIETPDQAPAGAEPGIQPEEPVAPTSDMPEEPAMAPVSEADNTSTFESINAMRKAAGLPVAESVLTDSTGHTLEHILKTFSREVKDFEQGGDLDERLYDALYDYYQDDMPYGTKKARDGDPYEWITDRLDSELGTGNYAPRDITPTLETMPNLSAPVAECNYTMEGEYCPEHGLAECGGTVAGAMAPVMGEGDESRYRFIRHNIWTAMDSDEEVLQHAVEGDPFYSAKKFMRDLDDQGYDFTHVISPEGKITYSPQHDPRHLQGMDEGNDDPINSNSAITGAYYESKEGDALLDRIKSLALIK